MFKRPSVIIITIILLSAIVGATAGGIAGFYATLNSLQSPSNDISQKLLLKNKDILKQIKEESAKKYEPIANSEEEKIIAVADTVNSAVVSVVVSKYVDLYYGSQQSPFNNPFFDDPFFQDFGPFKFFLGPQQQ
ncbi:MAG: hypothetical protein HYW78_00285, partial [Parcubacteria group bacterium]|nr:hypothetical protein [Parcubacteria group bacterium]